MAKSPEQSRGYKAADVIEKKSFIVGAGALALTPFIPGAGIVAIWEGAQIGVAEGYKHRVRAREMKAGVEYKLAA